MKKRKEGFQIQSVTQNLIMNMILKMSAFIFPMITFPYVSRVLGAAGNGKITFAASIVSYFSFIAQLGISTYGIRICATCRNDREKLSKTVQELLMLNAITVISTYIIFIILVFNIPALQDEKLLLFITSASILLNGIGVEWLFQAMEQYRYITVRNLAFKIISIILMFLFVKESQDYVIYGAISILGTNGANILNVFYFKRILDFKIFKEYNVKQHIKPSLSFFMITISIVIYTNMDTTMLGFLVDSTEVGYYAAATKMKMILVSAVTALGGVLLPRMSYYIANGKSSEFNSILRKSFDFNLIVTIPVTLYFMIMSSSVIKLLAGEGYVDAIMPMQVISLTIILIGLSNITGIQILVPSNKERQIVISTTMGAIVNILANSILIPRLGALGAAIGTVIAELMVLIIQVGYLKELVMEVVKDVQYKKIVFGNLISLIVLVCLSQQVFNNVFIELFVSAVVFFGIYGLSLIIMKESFVIEYWNRIKFRLKKL